MNKPKTVKQVAQILQVSTATVSNAFNRPDQLSDSLRESILKRCEEIGYYGPNPAARSLRRGESGVVAVILADSLSYNFSDAVANQFLQGVADVLEKNNKQLLLLSSQTDSAEQKSMESFPDGIIFYGTPPRKTLERIQRSGKPIIGADIEHADLAVVNIDNYQGAYMAADYLLQKGLRDIAVLGLRVVNSERVCRLEQQDLEQESGEISVQRLKGYRAAFQHHGVTLPPERVWHVPINRPEYAEQAAREALSTAPRPQAIVCMSDVMGLAVLREARKASIKVPDDLQVVGFDDIPEAARHEPALTTIHQNSREKGQRAATRLLNSDLSGETLLKTELKQRDSA